MSTKEELDRGVAWVGQYLRRAIGLQAAVAFTSVLFAESGLNSEAGKKGEAQSTEHGGSLNPAGAAGAAQWNGSRQSDLQMHAIGWALDPWSVEAQVRFTLTESANHYPTVWHAITDPALSFTAMIPIIVRDYEQPKAPDPEIARAVTFANELWPLVKDLTPTQSPKPSPAPPASKVPPMPPTPSPISPVAILILEVALEALFNVLERRLPASAPADLGALLQQIEARLIAAIQQKGTQP